VPEITISLDDELMHELQDMARESKATQDELVREGIRQLLQFHHGPVGIPRFARRLGPFAYGDAPSSGAGEP
jgi:hypothetical protein